MGSRAALLGLVLGCAELPEPSYFRDGFALATDFNHPVCEGTLRAFEQRIDTVANFAGREPGRDLQIYWLTDDITRVCTREVRGCFLPGTSIIASRQASVHHEIVHGVFDNRWSQHFLEEGVAEVLSGESVHFRPAKSDPFGALRINGREYRAGAVDYVAAAHFVHFLWEQRGDDFMRSVARAIDIGASPDNIIALFEREFGRGADGIQAAYRQGASEYYSGRARDEAWVVTAEDLTAGVTLGLDCDDADTMGPLDEATGGMYVAGRLHLDDWLFGYMTVGGDASVEVAIFREADREDGTFVQNWGRLDPSLDPEAIFASPGEGVSIGLSPEEDYILLVTSPDPSNRAKASIWLSPATSTDAPEEHG